MRLLSLSFENTVADAKTVWPLWEHLTWAGAIEELFAAFEAWLKGEGYLATSGQIIAASFVAGPRQRNTDAEMADLKDGRITEAWAAKPKKLAQKDRDARWTLKRAKARPAKADGTKAKVAIAISMFGDMSPVSIDRKHEFVRPSPSPARPPMTRRSWSTSSIRPTRRPTFGPILPAAPRPTKPI